MIDELKKNIDTELAILKEISNYQLRLSTSSESEAKIMAEAISSLINSIKIINNSIPELLKNTSSAKLLVVEEEKDQNNKNSKKTNLEKIDFKGVRNIEAVVSSKEREAFLKELSISEELIKKIKMRGTEKEEKRTEFKSARGYLKLSNKFFLKTSADLINKGYFKVISSNLKKANIEVLFQTYVAMLLFTVFISISVSLVLAIALMFIDIGFTPPFISLYAGSYFSRLLSIFWIPIIIPIGTYFALYYYPSTEKNSIEKKINQELPFAVIHMSAISGSGIAPVQIFKIIGLGKEYPNLSREIRKILNQINLYGYDLVTALNNVSKNTSSIKLTELFSGLSTTINSGGDLSEYFTQRAETLLMGYRLEREKFTKVAETFMDIYISVVIAAPMILMLLVVIISVTGIKIAFTSGQLSFAIILVIILINVIFLGVLQLKQPKY